MGRKAYTEPHYLYKGALYLYLYSVAERQNLENRRMSEDCVLQRCDAMYIVRVL
jgi:hypothetical protein